MKTPLAETVVFDGPYYMSALKRIYTKYFYGKLGKLTAYTLGVFFFATILAGILPDISSNTALAQVPAPGQITDKAGLATAGARWADAHWAYSIFAVLITFGGWIAILGGNLLDFSVQFLVIEMGESLTQTVGFQVNQVWEVIRDLFNVLFIFGLIYIGFKIILNAGDSSARKMLISLLAAALLINFSLLISKAVVDFSNLAAFEIYTNLFPQNSVSTGGVAINQIGTYYANLMELESIAMVQNADLGNTVDSSAKNALIIVYGMLMMIVLIIAGFVFAAGAVLLLARFVMLIVFLIFSPAMFLGMIFPQLGKYSSMWWSKFLNYAFVAPAYLFMLFLALVMTNAINSQAGAIASDGFGEAFATGTVGIFFKFAIIIAFLMGALVVAQKMGAAGATQSINVGKRIGRGAGNLAKLGGGTLTAATIGRASQKLLSRLEKYEEETGKPVIGSRWRRAALKNVAGKKFGGATSFAENDEYYKTRGRELTKANSIRQVEGAMALLETHNALGAREARGERLTPFEQDKLNRARAGADEARSILAGANSSDIGQIAKSSGGRSALQANLGSLSAEQFKAYVESENTPVSQRAALRSQRAKETKIGKLIATNPTSDDTRLAAFNLSPQEVREMAQSEEGKSQLRKLGRDTFTDDSYITFLQDKQMKDIESLVGDGVLSQNEYNQLRANRKKMLEDSAADVNQAHEVVDTRRNVEEISKLPAKFLESQQFADSFFLPGKTHSHKITTGLMSKLASESDLNHQVIGRNIAKALENNGQLNPSDKDDSWVKWFNNTDVGRQFAVKI